MTLFELLIFTAAVMPLVAIVSVASQLGVVGSIVGIAMAVLMGGLQLVFHYRALRLVLTLPVGRKANFLFIVYYTSILLVGGLCAMATLGFARAVMAL